MQSHPTSWGELLRSYDDERQRPVVTPAPNPRYPPNTMPRTNTLQGENTQLGHSAGASTKGCNRRETNRGFNIINNQSSDMPASSISSHTSPSLDKWSSFSRTLKNERRHLVNENSHAKIVPQRGSCQNGRYHADSRTCDADTITFLDKFPSVIAHKEVSYRKTKQLQPARDYDIISNVYAHSNDEKWDRLDTTALTRAEELHKSQRTRDIVRGVYIHQDVEMAEVDNERRKIVHKQNLYLAHQPPRMHYGEGRAYDILSNTDKDALLAQYYDKRDQRFLSISPAQQTDTLTDTSVTSDVSAKVSPNNDNSMGMTPNFSTDDAVVNNVRPNDVNAACDGVDPVVKWNLPRIIKPAKGRLQPSVEARYTELNSKHDVCERVKRETRMLESENTKKLLSGEDIGDDEKLYSNDPRTLHNARFKGKAYPRPADYAINGVTYPVRSKYESNLELGSLFITSAAVRGSASIGNSGRQVVSRDAGNCTSLWEQEQK